MLINAERNNARFAIVLFEPNGDTARFHYLGRELNVLTSECPDGCSQVFDKLADKNVEFLDSFPSPEATPTSSPS